MGWTTNPSPIITPKSKGWSVSPTAPSPSAELGWWAVVGIDTNLTVQFVTKTELTAIKQLGLVQAVTATRDLAFQAVKMLTVNAQIGATRNLGFSSVQNMSANQQVGLTPSLGFGFPPNGPLPQTFTTAIFTYTIPRWCNYIDVILLGGGGGGGGGASTTQSGAGGGPGSWLTVTLERGVHIPFSLVSFVGQLGTGGTGANGGITPTTGGNGNPTVIPSLSLSAAGGIGSASSNQDGMSLERRRTTASPTQAAQRSLPATAQTATHRAAAHAAVTTASSSPAQRAATVASARRGSAHTNKENSWQQV
ncbi:minor tail protein [Mycobacterium phage EvilGenius]|uniref:Minor tail protein n=1 Tax=Mycobacterium phage EvilGenius TaxID=1821723 RepID=A0A143FQN0_9CAUD|nr:minor tail protein [Mycobacterium phage EvilGenius]AMW64111.1 minor tail protein [Mycobacterium phage EvilGenius]